MSKNKPQIDPKLTVEKVADEVELEATADNGVNVAEQDQAAVDEIEIETAKVNEVDETKNSQVDEPENEQLNPPAPPEIQEIQVKTPNLVVISEVENKNARWYVLHTYSGHENKVAEMIRQRAETLNLTEKILEILIPTQEKIQIKRGQRKTVNEKIFPGYMLIHMELTDNSWLAVRTTQGVTGFVGVGNQPTALPKHEVEAIRKYMYQAAPQFKSDFVEGEAVKIVDGPFTDWLATVSGIDEEKGKVEVLVNIFDRETPVSLDFLQIKKV